MEHVKRFKNLLIANNHSVTKPRVKIFEALLAIDHPITTTQLATQLHEVDKVSIYRTIDLFEKVGIVQRVWSGFKSSIELSEAFSPHHHHFTCIICAETTSVNSSKLENNLHELEVNEGFKLTQHSIELRGHCQKCLSAQPLHI